MTFTLTSGNVVHSNETSQSITAIATHTSGISATSASHGYAVGDFVEISSTTDYNGAYDVISVSTNSFVVDATFTSSQTGNVARGDSSFAAALPLSTVTRVQHNNKDIYTMASGKLQVGGALKLTIGQELIYVPNVSDAVDVNGGILRLASYADSQFGSGDPIFSPDLVLDIARTGRDCCNTGALTIRGSGRLEQYGGVIVVNAVISIEDGAEVFIRDGYWWSHNTGGNCRVRCNEGTGIDIDGLTIRGIQWDVLTDETFTRFDRFLAQDKGIPIENATGTGGAQRIWKNVLDSSGSADSMMNNWQGQKDLRVYNHETGSSQIIVPDNTSAAFAHGGRVYREIRPKVVEPDGTDISGAKLFIHDTDNGSRVTTTTAGSINETGDRTYYDTSASDGRFPQLDILLAMWYRTNNVSDLTTADGNELVDRRSKNNDATDVFDIHIWSYGHEYVAISPSLAGTGIFTPEVRMFDDPFISEATQATVAAYTGIAIDHSATSITVSADRTLDEIYDYVKYNKTLQANIEQPTVSTLAAMPDGQVLDFGGYDITVSDGSTLSAGTNFTTFVTTGTVATTGTVSVSYTDSTGVLLLIKTDPVETLLRVQEYESDGTTLVNTFTGTSHATTGVYTTKAASDSKIRIYAKKWGYAFDRTNHDVTDGAEIDVSLNIISHIDPSRDISAYNDESDTGVSDRIYFDYDSTANKGNWVGGEINTSNKFIVTAALLDNRITTQDGLEFYAWFNVQTGVANHLQGAPFSWSHDRLEINEDHMQFTRISGTTGTQITRYGVNVKEKDGMEPYIAPVSQGSRVQFDNLAILVPRSTLDDISDQTRDDLERAAGPLQAIKGNTDKLTFNDSNEVASQAGTLDSDAIAAAVWNSPTADLTTADSIGEHLAALSGGGGGGGSGLSADETASAVWNALKSGFTTTGSIGETMAKLGFSASNDIKATLDNELTRVPHRVFLVWDGVGKIIWWGEDKHRLARYDFDAPDDVVGMTYDPKRHRVRIAVQPSGEAASIRSYKLDGGRVTADEFSLPSARTLVDISVDGDTLYGLTTGEDVYPYNLASSNAEGTAVSVSGTQQARAMDTWDGHHYIVSQIQQQVRAFKVTNGNETAGRRITLHASGDAPTNASSYGVTVSGSGIRVMDRSTGIFAYVASTTDDNVPEEHIPFQSVAYTYMAALPLARTADIQLAVGLEDINVIIPGASTISDAVRDEVERTNGPLQEIKDDAQLVRKYLKNKRKVDTTANTETIYEDDGTTNLQIWDLKDADGNAAVNGATEREPR